MNSPRGTARPLALPGHNQSVHSVRSYQQSAAAPNEAGNQVIRRTRSNATSTVPGSPYRLAQLPGPTVAAPNGPAAAPAASPLPAAVAPNDANTNPAADPGTDPGTTPGADPDEEDQMPLDDGRPLTVPLQQPNFERMQIKAEDGLVSLVVRQAPLRDVVTLLAETHGLNIVTADQLAQPISVTLERVSLNDALDAILGIAGYAYTINRNIILISNMSNTSTTLSPQAQGLRMEVFQLDYVTAADLSSALTGMLSPVGSSFTIASSKTDNRRSREIVAVNDIPSFLDRIRQYIEQIDIPPRQVMIEAHILQVELGDTNRHGVNFDQLFRRNGVTLFEMHTTGFASATPSQAFTFRFNDGNLTNLIEALRTQTDAKTLASPRLMVLNGQQARLQVGQQLGFRVTTTTETSTTESVDFLDVGVVLEITPRISRDGKIMLSVRPEVSSGQVNPTTGLPEEKTTELQTDILLCDHEGVVIGGLIQETDNDIQTKIPWLGDLYVVGRLFQRREVTKERKEIIVTLIPRLVPYESLYAEVAAEQFEQAGAPLFEGPLQSTNRPWEPKLADSMANPTVVRVPTLPRGWWKCWKCGEASNGGTCQACGESAEMPSSLSPVPPSDSPVIQGPGTNAAPPSAAHPVPPPVDWVEPAPATPVPANTTPVEPPAATILPVDPRSPSSPAANDSASRRFSPGYSGGSTQRLPSRQAVPAPSPLQSERATTANAIRRLPSTAGDGSLRTANLTVPNGVAPNGAVAKGSPPSGRITGLSSKSAPAGRVNELATGTSSPQIARPITQSVLR